MTNEQYDHGAAKAAPYGEQYGAQYGQPAPYGGQAQYPGYQQPYTGQQPYPDSQPSANGLGVAGFVTGILGVVLFWVPFLGLLLAACGIVLSAVGMSQSKRTGAPTGLAIAGLVLGILGALPALIIVLGLLSFGAAGA